MHNIIDIGQFLICFEERSFIQGLQGGGHEPSSGFRKPDSIIFFDRSNSVRIVFCDRSDSVHLISLPRVADRKTVCLWFLQIPGDSRNGTKSETIMSRRRVAPAIRWCYLWQPQPSYVIICIYVHINLVAQPRVSYFDGVVEG